MCCIRDGRNMLFLTIFNNMMQSKTKSNELIPSLLVEEESIPTEEELQVGLDFMKKAVQSVEEQFQFLREKVCKNLLLTIS